MTGETVTATMLSSDFITPFTTAIQSGISLFSTEPLIYVVIAGVLGFGIGVVLRIFGKLRKRA